MGQKEVEIGIVDHWWGDRQVAGIRVAGDVRVGDTLHFRGRTTDFTEKIGSIQLEHTQVPEAHAGEDIGIKVSRRVRAHDKVYKVVQDTGPMIRM